MTPAWLCRSDLQLSPWLPQWPWLRMFLMLEEPTWQHLSGPAALGRTHSPSSSSHLALQTGFGNPLSHMSNRSPSLKYKNVHSQDLDGQITLRNVEGHLKMSPYSFASSLQSLSGKNCLFCSRDCHHFWVCGLLCVAPVEWFLLWVSVKLWSVNRLLEEPSHQVEGVGFWFLAVVQVYLISVSSPHLLSLNLLRFKHSGPQLQLSYLYLF